MKILVGCEESGKVRNAFAAMGHEAWSCDFQPSRSAGNHYQCDIQDALYEQEWDIIILHPDCTKLAVSGNRWYGKGTKGFNQRIDAIVWTAALWQTAKKRAKTGACLENPVGVLSRYAGMYYGGKTIKQYIHPWQFGHAETKKTCLFLHNLSPLVPTNIVHGRENRIWKMAPGETRKRDRSETYDGWAQAMATQWGKL